MLRFDNRALRLLPLDSSENSGTRQVFGACFSRVSPTPVKTPRTLAVASEVAELLELPADFVQSQAFAEVFGGNRLLEGMDAVAACYGGHQVGNLAGPPGDVRATLLRELVDMPG